ncbi:MAG: OPT/YSL family transporter [Deltaproteobacteria bacterium]|nr:OPT/YSL family transporter [Deltaproteobacteria bacterium]
MAIKQLTPEQIRTWSLEQKDRWWKKEVFKGDMPQLTLRSAATGVILGGILSLTNLYVGIRTGWTLGVGITSVILAFALFKIMSKFNIHSEITLLENNAMQSIATAAGYMTGPLVSSIAAYMLITGEIVPMYQTILWIIFLSILGVLFAFPLKRRFINDEQMPFPEGRAAGVVMDSLHSESGAAGMFKAKVLFVGATVSAFVEMIRNEHFMSIIRLPFLKIPAYWDDFIYRFATPTLMGTPLRDLTIRADTSIVMVAAGGLMGLKTGVSLLLGATVNYFILAPQLIHKGIIQDASFKSITMWALWGGVSMMTTASLYSFFSKPKVIIDAFVGLFRKRSAEETDGDILRDIELPMNVFLIGIPAIGAICVTLAHVFFGVSILMGIIAVPLVFVFTLIAVNSTGLTSITPTGALGKLTQLTYSVIAPGNITTNIMTAGITGEVAGNASNLLMDIKPGYMLGAKPRHQAIGHVIGILAGSVVAVPVFYTILNNDLSLLTSEKMPMPSAQIWRAVAEVLTQGLGFLHSSAQIAIVVGGVLGILFEIVSLLTKGRFPISGVGMGLAFILPFSDSLAMATGAILFGVLKIRLKNPNSRFYRIFIDNHETVCAGGIAGGALIGIVLILLETLT